MKNNIKIDATLCDSCVHHYLYCGVLKVCLMCAPNWDIVDNKFVCQDYENKEEKNNEKTKSS